LLNLAIDFLLDSAVSCVDLAVIVAQFSYWFYYIWLLVLLGLSMGFCWILILALVGLDCWCVKLLLVHYWLVSAQVNGSILYKLSFGLGLLDSDCVWFGFPLFSGWILQLSFVPLCGFVFLVQSAGWPLF